MGKLLTVSTMHGFLLKEWTIAAGMLDLCSKGFSGKEVRVWASAATLISAARFFSLERACTPGRVIWGPPKYV